MRARIAASPVLESRSGLAGCPQGARTARRGSAGNADEPTRDFPRLSALLNLSTPRTTPARWRPVAAQTPWCVRLGERLERRSRRCPMRDSTTFEEGWAGGEGGVSRGVWGGAWRGVWGVWR